MGILGRAVAVAALVGFVAGCGGGSSKNAATTVATTAPSAPRAGAPFAYDAPPAPHRLQLRVEGAGQAAAAGCRTPTTIDPLRWIARAKSGTIVFQNGRKDAVVPKSALQAIVRAAPRGTDVRWYPGGHGLTIAAFEQQLDWLASKLPIRGPAVAGAKTGP